MVYHRFEFIRQFSKTSMIIRLVQKGMRSIQVVSSFIITPICISYLISHKKVPYQNHTEFAQFLAVCSGLKTQL